MSKMNIDFVKNALRRVENSVTCQSKWDIIDSFMGSVSTVDEFEERLVELLKYADVSNRSDGELRDAGLMRLPKDADGVPLHIGDSVYARCESETHGHYYYFNGKVNAIEIEKDGTYSYVTTDGGDGDQFKTCELHHGSHIPTSGQIVEDLVDEAFNLGADKERAKERWCNTTEEARKELVRRFTERLKPLLSDDAE